MKPDSVIARPPMAPVPRITAEAFCESAQTARAIEAAARDRRMERAHVSVHMGGLAAALEAFCDTPTPNLIIIESGASRQELIVQLEKLAELCDSDTKVVISGEMNDILLYRELIARGVSEYLVTPFGPLDFLAAVSGLYSGEHSTIGKIIAVTGAKGGTGASTIAHNTAHFIAHDFDTHTAIADLDLGFGTAGLDYNKDPLQGVAEAVFAPDRIDENLVDRLLTKCAGKLSLLPAPATLERTYDFTEAAFDPLIDILRTTTPCVLLDIPHGWCAWSRRLLVNADAVAIVAEPDLANLRNVKNMFDVLRSARVNDAQPLLIMNRTGVPKRPEISVGDFAKAAGVTPAAVIPFEPKLFGAAANNGEMIAELEPRGKTAELLKEIAQKLSGSNNLRKAKRNLLDPLIGRLRGMKAS